MDDETLKKFAYVNISSYRLKALKAINTQDKTPTEIAKESGIRMNHISNVLKQLKETDVAVCINEENKRNRIYRLTDTGKEILEYIEKEQ